MTKRVLEALQAALKIDGKEIIKWEARALTVPTESSDATTDAKNT